MAMIHILFTNHVSCKMIEPSNAGTLWMLLTDVRQQHHLQFLRLRSLRLRRGGPSGCCYSHAAAADEAEAAVRSAHVTSRF